MPSAALPLAALGALPYPVRTPSSFAAPQQAERAPRPAEAAPQLGEETPAAEAPLPGGAPSPAEVPLPAEAVPQPPGAALRSAQTAIGSGAAPTQPGQATLRPAASRSGEAAPQPGGAAGSTIEAGSLRSPGAIRTRPASDPGSGASALETGNDGWLMALLAGWMAQAPPVPPTKAVIVSKDPPARPAARLIVARDLALAALGEPDLKPGRSAASPAGASAAASNRLSLVQAASNRLSLVQKGALLSGAAWLEAGSGSAGARVERPAKAAPPAAPQPASNVAPLSAGPPPAAPVASAANPVAVALTASRLEAAAPAAPVPPAAGAGPAVSTAEPARAGQSLTAFTLDARLREAVGSQPPSLQTVGTAPEAPSGAGAAATAVLPGESRESPLRPKTARAEQPIGFQGQPVDAARPEGGGEARFETAVLTGPQAEVKAVSTPPAASGKTPLPGGSPRTEPEGPGTEAPGREATGQPGDDRSGARSWAEPQDLGRLNSSQPAALPATIRIAAPPEETVPKGEAAPRSDTGAPTAAASAGAVTPQAREAVPSTAAGPADSGPTVQNEPILGRSLVENAVLRNVPGGARVEILLHPDSLGRVAVRVMERGGLVQVAVRCDSQPLRTLLAGSLPSLLDRLGERGWDISQAARSGSEASLGWSTSGQQQRRGSGEPGPRARRPPPRSDQTPAVFSLDP